MVSVKNTALFAAVFGLILLTGFTSGWNSALLILNMGLISAIMAIGVNLQWGFAGLFNIGVMGFLALGGLAAVLVSEPVTPGAWSAGGFQVIAALLMGFATIALTIFVRGKTTGRVRTIATPLLLIVGFFIYRAIFDPAVARIEAIDPAVSGNIGGLNLPILFAWPVGGVFAAAAAWVIGKTALGLRSDYLAIATLGISEIVIAVMKNEDWLARGVKNVIGIERPVPSEIELQESAQFVERAASLNIDPVTASTLYVKLSYSVLFVIVLLVIFLAAELALKSPWGRMMRAIRDNETAARAMGKDVTARHLQIFVLGSAICGVAGAMMVTLDGQLTPSSYQPLRFTFLIWVMVIVGGSGNNYGSVLGGFLIWFLWVQVEPYGAALMGFITDPMPDAWWIKERLLASVAHMRLLTMGLILLLVLRFFPRGLIPEK